ncbi:MAG: DUF3343 domain-containing protein [Tissierellia bacterium]|nr:DUF3343 domain-containing protein [Tissierellia bacterium]
MKYFVLVENAMIANELSELLRKEGIKLQLAPTPREADHCCGVAIYLENGEDSEKVKIIAKENNIKIDQIFISKKEFDTDRNKFL